MKAYSIINLKTDPELKKKAAEAAEKLGISLSAVLNNELRRFAVEQTIIFELPEIPNAKTAKLLDQAQKEFEKGDYYKFNSNKEALEFLANA